MERKIEAENEKEKEKMHEESFAEICSILAEHTDKKFVNDFLGCLLTPAERKDFSNRWILVKEIYKGTTQREIASKYGMSLCKITRGSRELNKEGSVFKKILDEHFKK